MEGNLTVAHFLSRWKPAATARTHVLAGAVLWTTVGTALAIAGTRWCLESATIAPFLLLAAGGAVGVLKGRFALTRTAARSAARIARRGDDRCLGGFLSWQSWLFVLGMMGLGVLLRRSPIPRWIIGAIYTAVGVALLWGSRVYWVAWRRHT